MWGQISLFVNITDIQYLYMQRPRILPLARLFLYLGNLLSLIVSLYAYFLAYIEIPEIDYR